MVVLIPFFLFLFAPIASADIYKENVIQVIYDYGAPDKSIAVIGRDLFEMGDRYETLRVHHFEEEAIIFEDQRDGQVLKFTTKGSLDSRLQEHALSQFIVNQLETIQHAQAAYYNFFQENYAPDLETLVAHGYLADGFNNWKKQGYHFEITETGRTPKHAIAHENMPTFYALASPVTTDGLGKTRFFSVDYLGQVRFGYSRDEAFWGPVWDYQAHLEGPKMRDIGLDS